MREGEFHVRQSGGCHETRSVVGGRGVTDTLRGAPDGAEREDNRISIRVLYIYSGWSLHTYFIVDHTPHIILLPHIVLIHRVRLPQIIG